ncbi:MAG TPA: hypothetical protein VMW56_16075, partial [Candidatus Margulisiibacteriota bacterium]|nr:hypothetical protein [Candidatus Margulisiibacteriota bacterium]
MRCQHRVLRAAPARAGRKTCLTGSDPQVANDGAQIAATRLAVENACQCVDYSYESVSAHADYVSCVNDQIAAA